MGLYQNRYVGPYLLGTLGTDKVEQFQYFCEKCNRKKGLSESTKFCSICGTEVSRRVAKPKNVDKPSYHEYSSFLYDKGFDEDIFVNVTEFGPNVGFKHILILNRSTGFDRKLHLEGEGGLLFKPSDYEVKQEIQTFCDLYKNEIEALNSLYVKLQFDWGLVVYSM